MTVQAIDATGLSLAQIQGLKAQGVKAVGRYLSKSTWKGLSKTELENIKNEGMQVISIYESNPTHASYFSFAQGQADANAAYGFANALGQPEGTPIYFTVDYDGQPRDFPAIRDYFKGLKSILKSYKIGAYGSFAVVTELHANSLADYYFQTCAWSGGQKADFLHIYQAECNTTVAGVSVDVDELLQTDVGAWPAAKVEQPPVKVEAAATTTPSAPAKEYVNIVVDNASYDGLKAAHDYVEARKWTKHVQQNGDDSFNMTVGLFDKVGPSYRAFKDFLEQNKYQFSEIAVKK